MRCNTMRFVLLLTIAGMQSAGSAIADELVVQEAVAVAEAWVEIDGAAPAANDENAMLDSMVEQMRPLLVVELSFAKRSAKLDDDEMVKLIPECRSALREHLKQQMKGNNNRQAFRNVGNMIMFGNGNVGMNQSPDQTQHHLTEHITRRLKAFATDEQIASYERELKARDEYRKQATIAEIIAMYDEALLLTEEQRQKIGETLHSKWDDNWAANVEALQQYGDQYYPVLPGGTIDRHLTPEQKSRFSSLQQVSATMGIGSNMYGTQLIDDVDVKIDEKPAEPEQAIEP